MRRIATDILTRASSQVQPEGEEPDGAAKDDPPAREEQTIGEAGDELRALEARAKQLLQLSEHALARSLLANPADPVQSPQRYVYARDRDGRLVSPREAPTYKEPRGAPMDLREVKADLEGLTAQIHDLFRRQRGGRNGEASAQGIVTGSPEYYRPPAPERSLPPAERLAPPLQGRAADWDAARDKERERLFGDRNGVGGKREWDKASYASVDPKGYAMTQIVASGQDGSPAVVAVAGQDAAEMASVEANVAAALAEAAHLTAIVPSPGVPAARTIGTGSAPEASGVGRLMDNTQHARLPYYPLAGWGWEEDGGGGGGEEDGRFLTRSEAVLEAVYRDSQRMPGLSASSSGAGASAPHPLHYQAPRRVDEWWYNDTGVVADSAADRAHPVDTDYRHPSGGLPGGWAGGGGGGRGVGQVQGAAGMAAA